MGFTKEQKKEYAIQRQKEAQEVWFETILKEVEGGTPKWRKPWKGGSLLWVKNVQGHGYRGGNPWFLMAIADGEGYADPRVGTRKQLMDAGFSVRGLTNGTGYNIVFYNTTTYEKEDKKTGETTIGYSRFWKWSEVWFVEQCENYEPPEKDEEEEHESVEEHVMMKYFMDYVESQPNLTLLRGGSRAYYRVATDTIKLPKHEDFTCSLGEVMTAFHEAAHSTGHVTRCERPMANGFGSPAYAFEELVAELTSLMVIMELGGDYDPNLVIEKHANNTSYIAHWAKSLKDRDNDFPKAFSRAQAATDYILNAIRGDKK